MLFLGDFVYVDVPVYAGPTKEDYRRMYRRNYISDDFRDVYEHLREYINKLLIPMYLCDAS
jgi:alkaline phosphatase D